MVLRKSRKRRSKSPCRYGRKKSMRKGCKSRPGPKRKSVRRSRRKSMRRSRRKSMRRSRRKSVRRSRRKSVRRSRRKSVRRSRRKSVRRSGNIYSYSANDKLPQYVKDAIQDALDAIKTVKEENAELKAENNKLKDEYKEAYVVTKALDEARRECLEENDKWMKIVNKGTSRSVALQEEIERLEEENAKLKEDRNVTSEKLGELIEKCNAQADDMERLILKFNELKAANAAAAAKRRGEVHHDLAREALERVEAARAQRGSN